MCEQAEVVELIISVALPKGYTLRVVSSDGRIFVFRGVS
jgi:hypothetical protein